MAQKIAAGAILFCRDGGKTYFMTVQRWNTKKWKGSVMMGPAETMDDRDDGNIWKTLRRGLREELGLIRQDILSIKPYERVIEREVTDAHGYDAKFFFVEIHPRTMGRLIREVNANKHHELHGARLVRRLSAFIPKAAQPHYRTLLGRLKNDATPISRPRKRPPSRP